MPKNKISGNLLARAVLAEVAALIQAKQKMLKLPEEQLWPRLGIINVGEHPASLSYIRKKANTARKIHIKSRIFKITDPQSNDVGDKIVKAIKHLNNDARYHGILLQLPLPETMKEKSQQFLDVISPFKDIDCLTTANQRQIFQLGESADFIPCTVQGILRMLDSKKISVNGKKVLLIGKGQLTGKPLEILLKKRSALVTAVDREDSIEDIKLLSKAADIIFSATGTPDILAEDDLKDNCIVIDIGVSRDCRTEKVRGDIEEEIKQKKCQFYSPVPKGVGPMTVASLMYNVYLAWSRHIDKYQ